MAYRLIFTSAPRALTGARTGFCTVARSKDMSEKLAGIVEKFGAYEHEKNLGKPVYTHRKLTFASEVYHVLTRVVECPPDYTNRSNYIADSLVIPASEIEGLPTPAEVILNKADWYSSWTEDPKWLENETISKAAYAFVPPAKNWEANFKDAGKAALLTKDAPAIFASANDGELLLKLFAESASLYHNKMQAWDYTFTTSLADSETSADFNWRAIVSENSVLGAIDLNRKTTPELAENAFSNYARTAQMSNADRLGFKYQPPSGLKPKINIARVEEKKPLPFVMIAAIVAASLVFLLLIYFVFLAFNSKKQRGNFEDFATPLPAQKTENMGGSFVYPDDKAQNFVPASYSVVMDMAKDAVAANDWQGALSVWDKANLDIENPNGRDEIISKIGQKVDKLLSETESLEKNMIKRSENLPQIKKNLELISKALKIQNLSKKEERTKRFLKLEDLTK